MEWFSQQVLKQLSLLGQRLQHRPSFRKQMQHPKPQDAVSDEGTNEKRCSAGSHAKQQ